MNSMFRFASKHTRVALLPALFLAAACDDDPIAPAVVDDIVDIVATTSDVSTLGAGRDEPPESRRSPGPSPADGPIQSSIERFPRFPAGIARAKDWA